MTRVLIVEDEPQLLRALSINLRARRYDVTTAPNGASALRAAASTPPDLVILDLGCRTWTGGGHPRSARLDPGAHHHPVGPEGQGDKVDALDAGADDY